MFRDSCTVNKTETQKCPAKFTAYLFGSGCTHAMLVPVPAHSRSIVRTSYHVDDIHASWWIRPGVFQTNNKPLLVRDYVSPNAGYSEEELATTFFVYSYKQWPLQDLPRNFLLDRFSDNEAHHYGSILVFKLDSDNCVHSIQSSDFALMMNVVFRLVYSRNSRASIAQNFLVRSTSERLYESWLWSLHGRYGPRACNRVASKR